MASRLDKTAKARRRERPESRISRSDFRDLRGSFWPVSDHDHLPRENTWIESRIKSGRARAIKLIPLHLWESSGDCRSDFLNGEVEGGTVPFRVNASAVCSRGASKYQPIYRIKQTNLLE